MTLGAGLLAPSAPSAAATGPTVVTTLLDVTDSGDGETTLREAIANANGDPAADTITFEPGLTGPIQLSQGDLIITTPMTIDGPSSGGGITVVADVTGARVFDVQGVDGAPLVVGIDDLTITGGDATGNGGGILATYADLTLTRVTLSGNEATGQGGGVAVRGDASSLTVSDSTVSGNESGLVGSAISVYADDQTKYPVSLSAALTISGSEISGNTGGAAIAFDLDTKYEMESGTVDISGSDISGNVNDGTGLGVGVSVYGKYVGTSIVDTTISNNLGVDTQGGGAFVSSAGPFVIDESFITGNTVCQGGTASLGACDPTGAGAGGIGGGLRVNASSVEITASEITGNTASRDSGGAYIVGAKYGSAGSSSSLSIAGSTIADNSAGGNAGGLRVAGIDDSAISGSTIADNTANGRGGGILHESGGSSTTGFLLIENSTLSGNTAGATGGGLHVNGGSSGYADELEIRFTTITGNTATTDGGGVYLQAADAVVSHVIVAGNDATDSDADGDEVAGTSDSTAEVEFSLVQGSIDPDITATVDAATIALLGANPLLGPLADNGGPTETHRLLLGSPAIDAGDPAFAPPPNVDQRGEPRPVDGPDGDAAAQPDIGAFERQPDDIDPGGGGGVGGGAPPATVQLQSASARVGEDGGSAVITLTRTGSTDGAVSVRFRTVDGSATSPDDYTAVDQVVTFAHGQSITTVAIPIVDDFFDEGTHVFRVSLSESQGASLGAVSEAIVEIIDDADRCRPDAPMPFRDVPRSNTHFDTIRCSAQLELARGKQTSDTYDPAGVTTRAQMASFVARTMAQAGFALPSSPPDAFDDDTGDTHELAINQLAALGIVQGTGPRQYSPNATVSRAQVAGFVVRAFEVVTGRTLTPTGNHFDDDDGVALEREINAGFEAGLFQGRGPRQFSPSTDVHRDQMASFLVRLVDALAEAGFAPPG